MKPKLLSGLTVLHLQKHQAALAYPNPLSIFRHHLTRSRSIVTTLASVGWVKPTSSDQSNFELHSPHQTTFASSSLQPTDLTAPAPHRHPTGETSAPIRTASGCAVKRRCVLDSTVHQITATGFVHCALHRQPIRSRYAQGLPGWEMPRPSPTSRRVAASTGPALAAGALIVSSSRYLQE